MYQSTNISSLENNMIQRKNYVVTQFKSYFRENKKERYG